MKSSLLFLLFFLSFGALGQLSGAYTVGAPGDDFETLEDAIWALQNQGFGGPVEFLISDGEYGQLNLVNIGATAANPLVVRPASGNPYSVVFYSSLLKDSEYLTLSKLSFRRHEDDESENAVMTILNTGCRLSQCRIIDSFFVAENRYEPVLRINNQLNTSIKNQRIDTCFIYCQDGVEYGDWGSKTIEQRGNNASGQYYSGDTIWGAFDFWTSEYYREFRGCHFYNSGGLHEVGTDLIDSCFVSFSYNSSEDVKADEIRNSVFEGSYIYLYGYEMHNCEVTAIEVTAGCAYTEDCVFNGVCSVSPGVMFRFYRNEFHGEARITWGPGEMTNNFFYGYVTTPYTAGISFYGNNFGPEASFESYNVGKYINNNFANLLIGQGLGNGVELSHNNYNYTFYTDSEFYSSFDDAPTYYDPQYTSATDLHINNPALFSNARYLSLPQTAVDIDLETRGQIRSRGADEACLSLPLLDTVRMDCGTLFELRSCTETYQWVASEAFVDTIAGFPFLRVDTTITVWLKDENGVMLDSMVLIPFIRPLAKRNLYLHCGMEYRIATMTMDGAEIYWNPAELVDDPTDHVVSMSLNSTTLFVVTQDLGSCGVRYDSIVANVYATPVVDILLNEVNCNTLSFEGYAFCYDSLLWSFGDGTFNNTDLNVTHSYAEEGEHELLLTVWFPDTVVTYGGSVETTCAGLREDATHFFEIYPNPASSRLTITTSNSPGGHYLIMSSNGVVVKEGELNFLTEIDVDMLAPGIYFVRIGDRTKTFVRME